ncbi:purple acid phosphatase family protein [Pseudoalteromonas prydzensis]|uniref:purple acid phosphatase family protein n=1 Tax=Pseudoalteromonas prydzensis TaxID=182141 RepID=UPI0024BC77A8|nr:metallophosphoesterase family protein [Pseudoalteromonas prydzensis]
MTSSTFFPWVALSLLIFNTALANSPLPAKSETPYEQATSWPDRIIATATENPAKNISLTWRTNSITDSTYGQIVAANSDARYDIHANTVKAITNTASLKQGRNHQGEFKYPANDKFPDVNYHAITFKNLSPDTLYNYRVSGAEGKWSPWQQIKTTSLQANKDVEFLYFGDAQNGIYSHWPMVLRRAWKNAANAEFAIYAGDLVNEGANDKQWSNWLNAGRFIHGMLPAVLVAGNHEYDWQIHTNKGINTSNNKSWALSTLWQDQFTLPPVPTLPNVLQETVYASHYPDLDIFVLNSEAQGDVNLLQAQAEWLDDQLQHSKAQWRIVTMHHPIFSSCGVPLNTPGQDEPEVRAAFLPILLKHNVDLVLQGHDHTYARGSIGTKEDIAVLASSTSPKKVKSVFVTSVAGPKTYPQKPTRWQEYNHYGVTLERIGENTSTYQIIKKTTNKLIYKSFTTDGKLYDGFTLEKAESGQTTLKVMSDLPEQRTFDNTGDYKSHHDLAE